MAKPLLVIELDEINSVPRVFYNGEEITKKVHVGFDWSTQKDKTVYGNPFISIEHFVDNEGKPYSKSIKYNECFQKGDSNV